MTTLPGSTAHVMECLIRHCFFLLVLKSNRKNSRCRRMLIKNFLLPVSFQCIRVKQQAANRKVRVSNTIYKNIHKNPSNVN